MQRVDLRGGCNYLVELQMHVWRWAKVVNCTIFKHEFCNAWIALVGADNPV